MSIYTWSNTALTNANADTDINWAEGQDPGTVNDSARQVMRKVATFREMVGGALPTAGTAGAYTLTYNHAPVAYVQGFYVCFEAHINNTAAPTLNVNTIGTAELRANDGSALAADDLVAGRYYMATYDATAGHFIVLNLPGSLQSMTIGDLSISGTFDVTGLSTLGDVLVTGTFTSEGIDDNATKIVATIDDTGIGLGDGTAAEAYRLDMRTVSDGSLELGAGPTASTGANFIIYGSTHATRAFDIALASGLTERLAWDNSATLWTMTGDLTLTGDWTLTGQALAVLDMGAQRVTDIGAATALTDAPQVGQVQDNDFVAADDSGAADAYVITLAPAITAYSKYQEFWFTTSNTNTGTSTINVNALGVKNIKRNSTDNLVAGDIRTDRPNHIIYDGTQFILQGAGLVEPGVRHKWLLAGGDIRGTVTSGASLTDGEFGTINLTVPVLNFANAAIRVADVMWTPPKSYDGGTIKVKLYWASGTAGGGNVEWDVAAAFLGDLDAIGGAVSTPVTVTAASPTTAEDIAIEAFTSAITPNGTATDDCMIAIRIRRLGNDANDTFAGTAGLIGIVVEYTVDAGTDA